MFRVKSNTEKHLQTISDQETIMKIVPQESVTHKVPKEKFKLTAETIPYHVSGIKET